MSSLTPSTTANSCPLCWNRFPSRLTKCRGDGAYDTRACYDAVLQRGAMPVFVPRRTAQLGAAKDATGWRTARNSILQQIEAQGRSAWRVLSGCTRQSIAENTMFRFKRLFGGQLWARGLETQRTEALVKCSVFNRMTQLGMPETVRVG